MCVPYLTPLGETESGKVVGWQVSVILGGLVEEKEDCDSLVGG